MGLVGYAPAGRKSVYARSRAAIKRAVARFIVNRLAPGLIAKAERRKASAAPGKEQDFLIAPLGHPYLRRWYKFPKNWFLNFYLHETVADDDNRALHDHPYLFNFSLILRGSYFEIMPYRRKGYVGGDAVMPVCRDAGDVVFRFGRAAHRLMLPADMMPCWSLFITGPRVYEWGFYCPNGWRRESEYRDAKTNGAAIGQGCD
jgi:hypothetical protein